MAKAAGAGVEEGASNPDLIHTQQERAVCASTDVVSGVSGADLRRLFLASLTVESCAILSQPPSQKSPSLANRCTVLRLIEHTADC